jgi:hypothetical protein
MPVWSAGARHRRRTPARAKRTEDTGAERPFLRIKSRSPGVRVRRFLSFASRIFGGPVWLNATSAPLSPRGADRSYCRTGGSLGVSPLPRPQVSPRAGVGLTPFAKASRGLGLGGPSAAGAAPRPHFGTTSGNALVWAGMRERIRARRGPGISFQTLNFCGSASPAKGFRHDAMVAAKLKQNRFPASSASPAGGN